MKISILSFLFVSILTALGNPTIARGEMFGLPRDIWEAIPSDKHEALCGRKNRKLRRTEIKDAAVLLSGGGSGKAAGTLTQYSRGDWQSAMREVRRYWGKYCRRR